MKKSLDLDTMSDGLYEKLITECKKKYADDEEIENTEQVEITNLSIEFEVEQ
jgi:hypothetical protein